VVIGFPTAVPPWWRTAQRVQRRLALTARHRQMMARSVVMRGDPVRRALLLDASDDLDVGNRHREDVRAFQPVDRERRPWVWGIVDT
jgi:ATP-dependent helicase YprA (DUF1998 family)